MSRQIGTSSGSRADFRTCLATITIVASVVASITVGCDDDGDGDGKTTTGGGTGGSPPAYVQDCSILCDATNSLGCEDANCSGTCVNANENAGPCADVLGGYVSCLAQYAAEIPNCYDFPPACEDAFIAFASCSPVKNGCGPAKCDDPGESSCSCWSICAGQVFRKNCSKQTNGFSCTCEVEGELVATCFEQDLACHVSTGCCEPFLPGNGGAGGRGGGGGSGT